MMGTRVGDGDPGALTFLMLGHNLTAEQLQKIVTKESGMLGIAGKSDMREIESAVSAGDRNRPEAQRPTCTNSASPNYIGAYATRVGGVDVSIHRWCEAKTRPVSVRQYAHTNSWVLKSTPNQQGTRVKKP